MVSNNIWTPTNPLFAFQQKIWYFDYNTNLDIHIKNWVMLQQNYSSILPSLYSASFLNSALFDFSYATHFYLHMACVKYFSSLILMVFIVIHFVWLLNSYFYDILTVLWSNNFSPTCKSWGMVEKLIYIIWETVTNIHKNIKIDTVK